MFMLLQGVAMKSIALRLFYRQSLGDKFVLREYDGWRPDDGLDYMVLTRLSDGHWLVCAFTVDEDDELDPLELEVAFESAFLNYNPPELSSEKIVCSACGIAKEQHVLATVLVRLDQPMVGRKTCCQVCDTMTTSIVDGRKFLEERS